jgi:imidazolonepropionase-like amidohydrolase
MKYLLPALLLAAHGCSSPRHAGQSPSAAVHERWLIRATRLYVAPDSPPIDDAWVLVGNGKIEAVGASTTPGPEGARSIPACDGGVVTAGFHNSHVHFIEAAFAGAATRPAAELERAVSRMLLAFGFTTVVDIGSDLNNTVMLRQRIERGELKGPEILTTGMPLFPVNGLPLYLRDLPPEFVRQTQQPANGKDAAAMVAKNFELGANATKLGIATPQGGDEIARMSLDVARAAADETHRRGGLVIAHPTDAQGVRDAVNAHVDVLAHTTIDPANSTWDDRLIRDLVARKVSVIPTLKLWGYEFAKQGHSAAALEVAFNDAKGQIRAFVQAGGQLLFGTDVGYMTDHDPTDEYLLMARAGLTPMQILASLTTAPAARWSSEARRGLVNPGVAADLVVLDADPATDVKHFANVKCTIRNGQLVFRRETRE